MNNKIFSAFFLVYILANTVAFAETFKIPLNEIDQTRLTQEMSKIDSKYRSKEVINENSPSWYVLKKYNFLNDSQAFYINCSEEFHNGSVVGINQKCVVGFNYALSNIDSLNVNDGFIENFAIAEIKDQLLARDIYKSLGNGVSPTTNFFSSEQLSFINPSTGNKFAAFRLRIECKRDDSYKNFACMVYAVK
jgi:hypothetical protein